MSNAKYVCIQILLITHLWRFEKLFVILCSSNMKIDKKFLKTFKNFTSDITVNYKFTNIIASKRNFSEKNQRIRI